MWEMQFCYVVFLRALALKNANAIFKAFLAFYG